MKTYKHTSLGTFTLVNNFSTGGTPVVHSVELLVDAQALALYLSACIKNKSGKSKVAHGAVIAVYKGVKKS